MIDISQQEALFIAIGELLPHCVSAYAIGGTALMLRSMKNSTLDIDIVFDTNTDRALFITALKTLGARESDVTLVYGLKEHTPYMLELKGARFDLFVNKIITSIFSEPMKQRAQQTHEFGRNFIIKAADAHDVLIMKSVTSREKDEIDIVRISQSISINWKTIVDEAQEQVSLGNEKAILSLGERLETLNNRKALVVPQSVLDSLWKLLKKQVRARKKEK